MRYSFPDGARLYCRNCREEQPHQLALYDYEHVMCIPCGRLTRATEVAATYATDDEILPRIILPARLLPGYVEETDDETS